MWTGWVAKWRPAIKAQVVVTRATSKHIFTNIAEASPWSATFKRWKPIGSRSCRIAFNLEKREKYSYKIYGNIITLLQACVPCYILLCSFRTKICLVVSLYFPHYSTILLYEHIFFCGTAALIKISGLNFTRLLYFCEHLQFVLAYFSSNIFSHFQNNIFLLSLLLMMIVLWQEGGNGWKLQTTSKKFVQFASLPTKSAFWFFSFFLIMKLIYAMKRLCEGCYVHCYQDICVTGCSVSHLIK